MSGSMHDLRNSAAALLVVIFMVIPTFSAEPINLGNWLEVFVDDYLIDDCA